MSVHCAFCGEEMLGAVNRCWRCGRTFAFAPTQDSEPPVRRAAIDGSLEIRPGDEPVLAAVVDDREPATALAIPADEQFASVAAVSPQMGESTAGTASERPPTGALRFVSSSPAEHLGSPFSEEFKISWKDRGRVWCQIPIRWGRAVRQSWRNRRQWSAARRSRPEVAVSPARAAFANASLVLSAMLGVVSLLLMRYPLIAVLIAVFGLLMAGISLGSHVRFRVLAAVAFCLLPLGIIAYREASDWQKAQATQQQIDNWDDE